MRIKSVISIVCATVISLWGTAAAFVAYAQNSSDSDPAVLYTGDCKAGSKNSWLTNFFTKHVGGDWDASSIKQGSYFYAEYIGTEDGIYLTFSSASGGPGWVAVYADETGKTDEGRCYSKFSYDNFSDTYGTDFSHLDQIQAYSNADGLVILKELTYVDGSGVPVDTGDGKWDRPDSGIAFIGDSIVQNPLTNGSDLHNLDWNGILGRTDCVNYGIGSQTTKECAGRINELAGKNYDKVVMLCGINDIGQGYSSDETIAYFETMISALKDKNPDTEIYIISVLPTTSAFFANQQDSIVSLDEQLKAMTEKMKNVTYVDCYSSFVGDDGYCKSELVIDGLHPNLDGYKIIADILNPYLDGQVKYSSDASYIVLIAAAAVLIVGAVSVIIIKKKRS
jgi:lysophospholipase L1-like esterase